MNKRIAVRSRSPGIVRIISRITVLTPCAVTHLYPHRRCLIAIVSPLLIEDDHALLFTRSAGFVALRIHFTRLLADVIGHSLVVTFARCLFSLGTTCRNGNLRYLCSGYTIGRSRHAIGIVPAAAVTSASVVAFVGSRRNFADCRSTDHRTNVSDARFRFRLLQHDNRHD